MAGGMALSALGFVWLVFAPNLIQIVAASVVFSIGFTPVITLTTGIVVGSAPPERTGAASAMSETSAELGGALGIAVLGSLGAALYRSRMADVAVSGVSADALAPARSTLGGALALRVVIVEKGVTHAAFADGVTLADDVVATIGHQGALALLEKAKSDHEAFVAGVVAVLEGKAVTKAADLANHHTCRLGKWYDAVSDQRVLSCPAFAAMVDPHQRVHHAGKRALSAHWQGDADAARAAAAELRQASVEVVALLERLAGEVRGDSGGFKAA